MRRAECQRGRHSRFDPPLTFRIPHSAFRIRFRAMSVQAIAWSPSGAVRIVDQRALPEAKIERDLESGEAVADAIRTLQLRGAPLIGIAAAMGLVAGTRELRAAPRDRFLARLDELARLLGATRPTAVNLRWALDRMARVAAETPESGGGSGGWERLQPEATAIWEEDRAMCRRIGEAGLPLIPDGAKVLTHCNAGALATGGIGTALAPLYLAHEAGRRLHVFVDETRPVLQGARLTAWELGHAGIPYTVIADAVAGSLMRQAQVAAWAAAVGRLLAERGAVLLCGGLGGVMSAAARGAKQAGGLTVGILPGNDPREANPDIDVALATGMGEMRNALIVRAASAVIANGGGWGTLSEIAMARRIETPVVGLHDSFTTGVDIPRVEQPDEAVRWALDHARHREV